MEDKMQKSLQCSVNNLAGDGKYEVCQPIKRGADGYVYRIQFRKTRQHAALKAIPKFDVQWDFHTNHQDYKKFKPNSARIKKAKSQMQIHQTLKSQFVVRLMQKFEDELNFYLIMEYFARGDLSTYLKKKKQLTKQQVRDMGLQVAKGIATLHNQKIVHRDIKPQNILLDDKNKIKICDFGCAARYSKGKDKDKKEKLKGSVGTLEYMAPQIIKSYDEKVDIWSYGILLYYLGTGRVPFKIQKQQLKELTIKINAQSIQQLTFPSQLSYSYENLVRRILVIDPSERITMEQIIKHPFFTGEEMRPSPKIRRERTAQSYDNLKKRTTDICNLYSKTANKQNSSSLLNHKNTHMQKSANNINDSMDSKKNNYMRNSNEFKMKKMDIPLEKMLLKKKLEEGICRKSIVCLEPIDCKGLQYAKKSEKEDGKTHEIVIDERGYIKKYIEKGQRVEISPQGRNIKISQGNIVKQYKCNTLHEKYEKVYLAYRQFVQKLKQYEKKRKQKEREREKSIVIRVSQQNWIQFSNRGRAQFKIQGNRYIINSVVDINDVKEEHRQYVQQYYIWLTKTPQIPTF